MGHQNFTCTSQMFDEGLNQNQSYTHPVLRMHYERASIPENVCFLFPLENGTARGFNSISHLNFSPRLSDYPLSTPNQETPGYGGTSAATSVGPYFPNPPNYAQYMPSSSDYSRVIPSMDNGRGLHKRKSPTISQVYERGGRSGYYSPGSSSDCSVSSGFQSLGAPSSGSRCFTTDRTVVAPNYNRGRRVLIGREGYQRNVRSRSSGSSSHPETNLMETYFSTTNTPRYLHMREPIDHTRNGELVGPSSSTTVREQGLFPVYSGLHGGNLASDNNGLNHDRNQFIVERSINNVPAGMGGFQGSIPISGRNSGVSSQDLHASAVQPARGGRHNYAQRYTAAAYRPWSLPHSGYTASSSEGGLRSGMETYASSRYSRLVRNGDNRVGSRSLGRISFDRSQSLSDESGTRDGLLSEMVMDYPDYNGSGNLLDQHRDMRLDIDNMSYEELLALEDRIGNVNTGLSKEIISKSLKMKTYCYSDKGKEKMEEETCIICQEEYRKEEEVGALNCGHDYHAECIKKWLLVKNVCPICKTPALPACSSKD